MTKPDTNTSKKKKIEALSEPTFGYLAEMYRNYIRDSKTQAAVNFFIANITQMEIQCPGYLSSETPSQYKIRIENNDK